MTLKSIKLYYIYLTAAISMVAVNSFSRNKSAGINLSLWKNIATQPTDSLQQTFFNLGSVSIPANQYALSSNLIANTTYNNICGVQAQGIANTLKGTNYCHQ